MTNQEKLVQALFDAKVADARAELALEMLERLHAFLRFEGIDLPPIEELWDSSLARAEEENNLPKLFALIHAPQTETTTPDTCDYVAKQVVTGHALREKMEERIRKELHDLHTQS